MQKNKCVPLELSEKVADEILKVADLVLDLTRSDLQGVATAQAMQIIQIINTEPGILTTPMTKKQVVDAQGKNGNLDVVLAIPLGELIDRDLDDLNQYADERIFGEGCSASLVDIHYKVVGHRKMASDTCVAGEVLIQVTGGVDFYN